MACTELVGGPRGNGGVRLGRHLLATERTLALIKRSDTGLF